MAKTSYAILKDAPDNSFINPNFCHKPALVLKDGTLFIVIDKYLYRSDDSGYTWDRKQRDVSGVGTTQHMGNIYYFSGQTAKNDGDPITCVELTYVRDYANGPAVKIEFGGGDAYANYPGISNSTHSRVYFLVEDDVYYDYGALVNAAPNTTPSILNHKDGGTDYFDSITDGLFSGKWTTAYATESTWDATDLLYDHDTPPVLNNVDYANRFCANGIHCLIEADIAAARDQIYYVQSTGVGTASESLIRYLTDDDQEVCCMSLDIDAYGTLCGFFNETPNGNFTYTYSLDNGANWSNHSMSSMGGVSKFDGPVDIMGCANGFIMLYTRTKDASGTPRLYARTLTTDDGITYTLNSSREAVSAASGVAVYGGHFFRPEEDVWYDLDRPGDIRIAYKAGNAIEQELLSETAYPSSSIVNKVGENVDFINEPGASGNMTTLYLEGMDELGVTCTFHKFVPLASGKMNDKSGYDLPIDSSGTIVIDPESYRFPIPDLDSAETYDFIERDVRKVFLKPNFHLDREFLVNEGNFLKRTVWTMDYDGNSYELSQVVPRFLDEQICFYTSNAYVIGQSRDPWSRTVLLSET